MQRASDYISHKKKSKCRRLTDLRFEKCSCQKCLVESGTAKLLLLTINMSTGFVLTVFFKCFESDFNQICFLQKSHCHLLHCSSLSVTLY